MTNKISWLERPILPALPGITNEIVIFAAIILLTVVTRFYDLESRVMSHDESLHTYFSWLFYRGQGYEHSPMMHGPLQFHLLALSYFLFGVTDFTARIPAVLFSIATVWMVWYWRRYLGRTGALVAGFLMAVSPFMLYYGRYVRNEAFAGLAGVLMLYAMLRYLEKGSWRYLYMITLAMIVHFLAKETAFIYAAQALIFLAIYLVARITSQPWPENEFKYRVFIITLSMGILLILGSLVVSQISDSHGVLSSTETAAPADPNTVQSPLEEPQSGPSTTTIMAFAGVLVLLGAAALLISGYGWERLKGERSFDLAILIGTMVLPMLAPFPVKFLETWLGVTIPTTVPELNGLMANPNSLLGLPRDLVIIGAFIVLLFGLSIAIGLLWNRNWWKQAVLFWGIFTIFQTSVFTNSSGFFTGLVGSLGYWLVQQGVERGSQPWYFYVLVQIPLYEFLPALGVLLATYFGIRKIVTNPGKRAGSPGKEQPNQEGDGGERSLNLVFALLLWWVVSSIAALSYAGERMPWLTYHMAWPMILVAGWGIGQLIESIKWGQLHFNQAALRLILTILFLIGLVSSISAILGPTPPFQGQNLEQLQATSHFLFPAVVTIAAGFGLAYLMKEEQTGLIKTALAVLFILALIGAILVTLNLPVGPLADNAAITAIVIRLVILLAIALACLVGLIRMRNRAGGDFPSLFLLTFFGFLSILTVRASFRAAFIAYDSATEYLVYAHGASGVKQIIAQAEEISKRTTGGMNLALSYDASAPDTGVSWPFVWYLRDYTNQRAFDQPTKGLRDTVFVVVDAKNFDKIEPALGPGYYRFDYIRMWWPNQDYFGLTRNRISEALSNPQIRAGIWDIWYNRDFSTYASATGHADLTPTTWQPSDLMRLYIRKDITSQIWDYGAAPSETVEIVDPTEGKEVVLNADLILEATGAEPVILNAPRSLAFAPDGTIFVADSRNHRIVQLDSEGRVLKSWGTFADAASGQAPVGTFNEPWGVAVGPDGSVYVSDTWNHRIQKFSQDGSPITTWGQYGQADLADAFWGPRGVAVDADGNVYVADTGNKRIVVFDSRGDYLTEFGTAGLDPGQFDEPVGVAVGPDGKVYVTDTWNQRVQTFTPSEDKMNFIPDRQWDVFGWYGQSLENKPFLTVNAAGEVFITDPELYRIIQFSPEGEVVRTWGEFGDTGSTFGLASGVAVDSEGRVWVTDGLYNRILRFTLP